MEEFSDYELDLIANASTPEPIYNPAWLKTYLETPEEEQAK